MLITIIYKWRFSLKVFVNHNGAVLYLFLTDYSAIRYAFGFEDHLIALWLKQPA